MKYTLVISYFKDLNLYLNIFSEFKFWNPLCRKTKLLFPICWTLILSTPVYVCAIVFWKWFRIIVSISQNIHRLGEIFPWWRKFHFVSLMFVKWYIYRVAHSVVGNWYSFMEIKCPIEFQSRILYLGRVNFKYTFVVVA